MLFCPEARLIYEGSWSGGYVEPRRRLYDNELVYVSEGRFQFGLEGKSFILTRGAILLIPPGVWHESRTLPGGHVTRHCIHFDWLPQHFPALRPLASYTGDPYEPDLISPVPAFAQGVLPLMGRIGRRRELREMIVTMFRYFRTNHAMGESMLWPVLRTLVEDSKPTPSASVSSGKGARLALAVRAYIESHYAEPQDAATYGRAFNASPGYLCRTFSTLMGRPPLAYLKEVRLNHARRLLQEGTMNINEVGRAVGIPDPNYFSRLFRRQFGKSPSGFLEQRYALSGPAGK